MPAGLHGQSARKTGGRGFECRLALRVAQKTSRNPLSTAVSRRDAALPRPPGGTKNSADECPWDYIGKGPKGPTGSESRSCAKAQLCLANICHLSDCIKSRRFVGEEYRGALGQSIWRKPEGRGFESRLAHVSSSEDAPRTARHRPRNNWNECRRDYIPQWVAGSNPAGRQTLRP